VPPASDSRRMGPTCRGGDARNQSHGRTQGHLDASPGGQGPMRAGGVLNAAASWAHG
jgi:hypothetical protein